MDLGNWLNTAYRAQSGFTHLLQVVGIALLSIGLATGHASAQDSNRNAPVIEEIIVTTAPGAEHLFSAKVIDDVAVEQVLLYYREEGQAQQYRNVPLEQSPDDDWFHVEFGVSLPIDSVVDYYIQAKDNDGNRSVLGSKFDPSLSINSPVGSNDSANTNSPIQTQPGSQSGTTGTEPTISTSKKILYSVLGILAIGALASSSGSSGGSTSDADCPETGCRLTITAPLIQ